MNNNNKNNNNTWSLFRLGVSERDKEWLIFSLSVSILKFWNVFFYLSQYIYVSSAQWAYHTMSLHWGLHIELFIQQD